MILLIIKSVLLCIGISAIAHDMFVLADYFKTGKYHTFPILHGIVWGLFYFVNQL